MRLLTHLRHVDLAVPDYAKQLDFYAGVWGLTKVAEDSGISFLAAEGSPEQYVVRLRKADEKRLDLVSYGAASREDVDTLAEELLVGGVRLISQPGKVDTPGGGYGFRFFDVDGRTIEVSADVEHAVYGPGQDVPVPPGSSVLDFELEVGAVIGREGRDLTPEQARDHIVGYTVFNDWSARDLQSAEMKVGLGPCKGKDTATTLGPYLVTADELEPHRDGDGFLRLALTAEINGQVVGTDLLSNMSWTFEEMTAYASRGTRVVPGDVLGSGTCGNGGCLAELWGRRGERTPLPLRPGDTVRLTVEGIGTLTNTVVAGVEPVPLPTGRRRSRERP
ncbi:hypothetical protein SGLAM104S_06223 [Streptomyces glaucescens]